MHTPTMPTPRSGLPRAALTTVIGNVLLLASALAYGLAMGLGIVTIIEQPITLHGVLVIALAMLGVGCVKTAADRIAVATRPLREALHEHRSKAI